MNFTPISSGIFKASKEFFRKTTRFQYYKLFGNLGAVVTQTIPDYLIITPCQFEGDKYNLIKLEEGGVLDYSANNAEELDNILSAISTVTNFHTMEEEISVALHAE